MTGRKLSKTAIGTLIALALVILGLAILLTWSQKAEPASTAPAEPEPPKETQLSFLCVGDVMSHSPQTTAQYDASEGKYNYDNNFKYVKDYIESADLALCNVETTFAGKPYTGFPYFSAPDALATALANAGFDVGITSNNHMADKGLDGILRTKEVLEKKGLATVGSVMEEDEPRYLIQEVKGVKVGIVAYTYETGSGSGSVSINGSVVSDEVAAHINSFNFNTLDEDLDKIKTAIDGAKDAGAEIIIAYYHWGEEYQREANQFQKKLAQKTVDLGADIIFASHPHVLQGAEYLTPSDSQLQDKKVPVFYSMGNFISNQRSETLGNRYTEEGLMAQVSLTYKEGEGITDLSMSGIPTWVDKYYSGGKQVYEIIPLDEGVNENESLTASGHLSRAKQALEDANGILGFDSKED
ncbi:CapA family protein [bacterium 210820-DFI.6.37]|nr:CapA family protein [bacterium 210820-DFI.6.37]